MKINGKQSVKLRNGSIKFKIYCKYFDVPFKSYTDFEFILKEIKINDRNNASYTEKYQGHISCSFAYRVVCIDDGFSKPVVLYGGKDVVNKCIEAILNEYDYCRKIIKKHFNKNLVMPEELEKRFQSCNKCWICNKLFVAEDNKVRDHDHVTKHIEVLHIGAVILILNKLKKFL